ncbi:PEP-CTERM sorting domain-containing protein [Gemmatimonas phototrophica]|uniref:Ice-binding protein C-terminal domain-containing protein n=1 Tax=Gemmatimonas phototrophica TaxID=1379270 RepID=A0A143BI84_9BACT|nr:PEP-CTERM sorting domain-containing protein [Gemmatimonas phototrophica]AMW04170.1 hypothetical protein GEMMAAP_03635 [Gemmatimonas phototrophica]
MRSIFAGAALLASVASTAGAQVTATSVNGAPDPGVGPLSTFTATAGQTNILNFNDCSAGNAGNGFSTTGLAAGISISGGGCKTVSASGQWAKPATSMSGGGFYTTTSYPNSPITIDFTSWLSSNSYNSVSSLSFYWGSIDNYASSQKVQLIGANGNVLKEILGQELTTMYGNQTAQQSNRRLNFALDASAAQDFRKLKFYSNQAAFEFDDIAMQTTSAGTVVPEPATVTLLASALGVLGLFGARRKRNGNTQG